MKSLLSYYVLFNLMLISYLSSCANAHICIVHLKFTNEVSIESGIKPILCTCNFLN